MIQTPTKVKDKITHRHYTGHLM